MSRKKTNQTKRMPWDRIRGVQLYVMPKIRFPEDWKIQEGERMHGASGLVLKAVLKVIDDHARADSWCSTSHYTIGIEANMKVGSRDKPNTSHVRRVIRILEEQGCLIIPAKLKRGQVRMRPNWHVLIDSYADIGKSERAEVLEELLDAQRDHQKLNGKRNVDFAWETEQAESGAFQSRESNESESDHVPVNQTSQSPETAGSGDTYRGNESAIQQEVRTELLVATEAIENEVDAPRDKFDAPRNGIDAPRDKFDAPRNGIDAPRGATKRRNDRETKLNDDKTMLRAPPDRQSSFRSIGLKDFQEHEEEVNHLLTEIFEVVTSDPSSKSDWDFCVKLAAMVACCRLSEHDLRSSLETMERKGQRHIRYLVGCVKNKIHDHYQIEIKDALQRVLIPSFFKFSES